MQMQVHTQVQVQTQVQVHTQVQVQTQVQNPLTTGLNACMICLEVSGDIIQYAGSCNCRPKLHIACLQQWLSVNSDTCPICRSKYSAAAAAALDRERDQDGCLATCGLVCILSMLFMPCCLH